MQNGWRVLVGLSALACGGELQDRATVEMQRPASPLPACEGAGSEKTLVVELPESEPGEHIVSLDAGKEALFVVAGEPYKALYRAPFSGGTVDLVVPRSRENAGPVVMGQDGRVFVDDTTVYVLAGLVGGTQDTLYYAPQVGGAFASAPFAETAQGYPSKHGLYVCRNRVGAPILLHIDVRNDRWTPSQVTLNVCPSWVDDDGVYEVEDQSLTVRLSDGTVRTFRLSGVSPHRVVRKGDEVVMVARKSTGSVLVRVDIRTGQITESPPTEPVSAMLLSEREPYLVFSSVRAGSSPRYVLRQGTEGPLLQESTTPIALAEDACFLYFSEGLRIWRKKK